MASRILNENHNEGIVPDRGAEIKKLQKQITKPAASVHPSLDRDRDIGGKKNKFDLEKARAEVS
jgi:hypothetical protein